MSAFFTHRLSSIATRAPTFAFLLRFLLFRPTHFGSVDALNRFAHYLADEGTCERSATKYKTEENELVSIRQDESLENVLMPHARQPHMHTHTRAVRIERKSDAFSVLLVPQRCGIGNLRIDSR